MVGFSMLQQSCVSVDPENFEKSGKLKNDTVSACPRSVCSCCFRSAHADPTRQDTMRLPERRQHAESKTMDQPARKTNHPVTIPLNYRPVCKWSLRSPRRTDSNRLSHFLSHAILDMPWSLAIWCFEMFCPSGDMSWKLHIKLNSLT